MAIGAQLAPVPRQRVLSNTGVVAAGAKLHTYAAGGTTPLATYSDSALSVANSTTMTASNSGLFGPIYLAFGQEYRFMCYESDDVTLIWDQDNIPGDTSPAQSSTSVGTQNNFVLNPGAGLLRLNNASLLTITGIQAGFEGQRLTLEAVGAGQVDLPHLSGSSSAGNKLKNVATSGATSLAPASGTRAGGTANYIYDGTSGVWQMVGHEQGAYITPTFAAGNFTALGGQTWTLTAPDVVTYAYYLKGRQLTMAWVLIQTSVGGTPNPQLNIAIPGGFTANQSMFGVGTASDNGTTNVAGAAQVGSGFAGIALYKDMAQSNNWTASANQTSVSGTLTFEVQ